MTVLGLLRVWILNSVSNGSAGNYPFGSISEFVPFTLLLFAFGALIGLVYRIMKLKILAIIIIIAIAGGIWFHYSNEKSAWKATFEWTGISALPMWAADKQLEAQGGFFTGKFFVSFKGTSEQIIDWLKTEPVLQNIKPEKVDEKTDKYILKPQGGSAYDEVKVDWLNNKVTIEAEWS
jgi:hypothetical protein